MLASDSALLIIVRIFRHLEMFIGIASATGEFDEKMS